MTNFKEHDGMLFKMLEEPTPLTPEAEMPCLVRLIQDDSPMGKHNKDLHGFDPERLTPKICTEIIDVNDLSDPNRGRSYCDGFMSIQYYRYELIGTPVKEGSEEWALYQMMDGKTVCQKNSLIKRHYEAGHVRWVVRNNKELQRLPPDLFLKNFANTMNWQIYKEPEQPKPLLADAQVGDLCKHRNGDWSQIIDTNGTYIPGQPIRTTLRDSKKINRNFCLSGSHFITQFDGEYDIIHTEPLAPEGSVDWAWQMLKLGKKVTNNKVFIYGGYVKDTDSDKKQFCLNWNNRDGWEIYKEPKPLLAEAKEQKPDNLYHNIKPSNPADWCFNKKNLLVLVDNNFKGIVGENVTREQVGEIAKLLTETQPAKEPMADCENCKHVCTNSNIDHCHMYEPKPESQYKVDDWVECVAKQGQRKLVDYLGGMGCYKTNYGEVISPGEILHKLFPSEVIVTIGCLSGTVKDLSYAEHGRFWLIGKATERYPIGMHAILYDEMLDTETRELVESLLEAQTVEGDKPCES